jgi:hypothetical protein
MICVLPATARNMAKQGKLQIAALPAEGRKKFIALNSDARGTLSERFNRLKVNLFRH